MPGQSRSVLAAPGIDRIAIRVPWSGKRGACHSEGRSALGELQAVTRDHSARGRATTATCALVIVGASLGDYATSRELTFGSVEVVAVAWAATVVGTRSILALVLLAWIGQAAGVPLGGISAESALLDAASTAAVAAVLWAAVRPGVRGTAQSPILAPAVPAAPFSDPLHAVLDVAPAALVARGLTARECQVVRLALVGLTASQIGRHLYIGKRTVETHLSRAYSKFGVHSRAEIAEELMTVARQRAG
jgi:DNA-binding CsgD family transcriptional regulator